MKTRRRFLQSLALAPALGAGCVHPSERPSPRRRLAANTPRHIVHLVADGMSAGTVSCADHFSQQLRGRRLTWFDLTRRPEVQVGFMDMRSQNSLVTDSSAASSAWGCGVRIPNAKVNQSSAGTPLVTLYELLSESGWKRGLVTTTEITHATPAGFAACVPHRDKADEIAVQYLNRKVEVLLGGGQKFFGAGTRTDKRDLKGDYARSGYAVLECPEDLAQAPRDQPWLGIFASSHFPYLVDQQGGLTETPPVPSLPVMARRALEKFRNSERFILQVEGGRVDHACHANDAAGAVREMLAFDEALDVCLAFQREVPGTLLVITTDHGTGNPGLNGMGKEYRDSAKLFRNLAAIRQSTGELAKRLLLCESREQMAARLKETAGCEITSARLEMLDPFLRKKGSALYEVFNSDVAALAQVLANHTGVSFTGTAHTSDIVPILALGPGAGAFRGLIECTQVFERYLDFAGLQFRNPQEPLAAVTDATTDTAENVAEYLHG